MLAEVGSNRLKVDLGYKSYTAYCSSIYNNGLIPRIETNDSLWGINLNTEFIGIFISKWFNNTKLADEFYSLLINPGYTHLRAHITSPLFLGMMCLSVERVNSSPKGLTNEDASMQDRENWLFLVIEELLLYTPTDRLHSTYLNIGHNRLRFYIELARFTNSEIIPKSEVLDILGDYTSWQDEYDVLNSVDEAGVILWLDNDNFGWADETLRYKLINLSYRRELWSRMGGLLRLYGL